MGGSGYGWDGGKDLQTHRMMPVGESKRKLGVGGWVREKGGVRRPDTGEWWWRWRTWGEPPTTMSFSQAGQSCYARSALWKIQRNFL